MHKQPCLLILAVVVSCTAPSLFRKSRVKIDLSYDRSACENTPFPFWFPLTGFETETLADIDKARSGDPHALLSLGLVASGNVGNADTFQAYHDLVERFLDAVSCIFAPFRCGQLGGGYSDLPQADLH